ncbi:unnamed protein product [Moneuplotes crassus]|uniref:Uncharacterized protein n=1 Tax=Euplotes crassus TaxID=5936 RepID=A0AAD1U9V9_EUPCR|nr:unnamed protein product [Moneuplotes crassus]
MPEEDKGWIAIAKSVVDPECRYRKIIQGIMKHKPGEEVVINKQKKATRSYKSKKHNMKFKMCSKYDILDTSQGNTYSKKSKRGMAKILSNQSLDKKLLDHITSKSGKGTSSNNLSELTKSQKHSEKKEEVPIKHKRRSSIRKLKRPTLTVTKLKDHSFKHRLTVDGGAGSPLRSSFGNNMNNMIKEIRLFSDNDSVSEGGDYIRKPKSSFHQKFDIKEWYHKLCSQNTHIACRKRACMEYTFTSHYPNIVVKTRNQMHRRIKSPEISVSLLMERGIKRRYLKGATSTENISIRKLLKEKARSPLN